jgi:L,D-peptidoglycan transpeptidase YkuD (ErfK/YbiS/YcfS/YnhG family)
VPQNFTAWSDGRFEWPAGATVCALGRTGVIAAADKREGDGKSPLGLWPMRRVLYRPDRGPAPKTALPVQALQPDDGWCDAPADPAYNRPVKLPYPASAEALWRDDHLYDLIVVLAHNDEPPVRGLGSAIFLHLAREGYAPTEGCIALSRPDLEAVLALAETGSALAIRQAAPA